MLDWVEWRWPRPVRRRVSRSGPWTKLEPGSLGVIPAWTQAPTGRWGVNVTDVRSCFEGILDGDARMPEDAYPSAD